MDFELTYPETRVSDVTDEYFGIEVLDPYRWLEDDNSEETAEWVKAQNEISFKYLEAIPYREKIKDRLLKLWDYPKVSAPVKKAGLYFYFKNDGLQNQNVLYYKTDLNAEEVELLDPNNFDKEGTVSLSNISISPDGKYLGYAISRAGSDWQEILIKDIESLKDLDDHLKWVKFSSIAWSDNGFYYTKYPEPEKGQELSGVNTNSKIYFHKVGTEQSMDILVYEDSKNPEVGYSAYVTDDKKHLIIYATKSTSGNALYYQNIEKPNSAFIKLIEDFDNDYSVVSSKDNKFYVYTNYQAPMYKMIEIDLNKRDRKFWKDVISETSSVLQTVSYIGERFIANYMVDAHSLIKIFDEQGEFLHDLDNEEIGSISGFSGDEDSDLTFYTFTSFTSPALIYSYDIKNNKSKVYDKAKINFNSEDYITKQIFYRSKDGTKVPMFIVHKKGIVLDGKNPTLLYGYGGFNISLTPSFSISRCVWLEQGGIVAIPNIRGGGEYGEDWHKAGTIMKKQNVFDDFIAAAEYLISNKYTSPQRLAIQGGSNGGLLVGAVTNQRPDLFAVALPAVGVMDMLRYHKFTIGRYWATDYGTSEDSKEMFEYLHKYSPVHNIKSDVEYPAVLVTTGDHDDRVVPAHSFKYISTLQANYKGKNPVLIRIETQAGHGAGKPTKKIIEEIADTYAFTFYNMEFTPVFE
ncbi:MAG: prolyl oligopeptidase family serine peptidase [Bacteroidales bacterium]|jgi:prolyl oligopeptidase|nr:prolyl oligopeptidase family serine peptidase [Bacteroidales bacterium]MCK9499365.1 prolyl oligopeptidase family serine peptidase [Bacteroidales bacterium]MDY0314795.1 prolyl oligopeptidase family serine peptidase [Bacteroidales bacterium]